MNPSKSGSSPRSRCSSILVQLGEHVLHARELLRGHLRHALRHLVEHGVEELLLELIDQLVERPPGLVVHEVVLLELADAPGKIGRQLVELLPPLARQAFEELLPAPVSRLAGVFEAPINAVPLLLDYLVEPTGDVLEGPAELVAVERLPASLPQPLEHLPEAFDLPALAVAEALLEHPAHRGVEIAVVKEIVGHLVE